MQNKNATWSMIHQWQWLAVVIYLISIPLIGCTQDISAVNATASSHSKNNKMTVHHRWTLPHNSQIPTSIVFNNDDSLWIANWSDYLLYLSPKQPTVEQIKVLANNQPEKVGYIAVAADNQLYLVVGDSPNKTGIWNQNQPQIQLIELSKEPRQIAWSKATNSLWYIATDLSLNIYANGIEKIVDEGKYNALIMAESGENIAVRQVGSNDVFLSSTQKLDWKKIGSNWQYQLIRLAANNSLLVLKVGLLSKGGERTDSQLISIQSDGTEKIIAVGPIITAAAKGNRVATVKYNFSQREMTVELSSFN